MQLRPLCRYRFTYSSVSGVDITGPRGAESQLVGFAEGRCEGRIAGRLRGSNHGRFRPDNTGVLDFQGIIETDDGAIIYFDYRGYGRSYPPERRQIVGSVMHLSDHPSYTWLNDVVCVLTGEVRPHADLEAEFVVDVAELVWEPIAE